MRKSERILRMYMFSLYRAVSFICENTYRYVISIEWNWHGTRRRKCNEKEIDIGQIFHLVCEKNVIQINFTWRGKNRFSRNIKQLFSLLVKQKQRNRFLEKYVIQMVSHRSSISILMIRAFLLQKITRWLIKNFPRTFLLHMQC